MADSSLSPEAIQRVLFIASRIHVYAIPPLNSNRGYEAASWTNPNGPAKQIFTARLRVLETAVPIISGNGISSGEKLSTEILLEDPASGQLFAGAPYTDLRVVEAAVDSSRFFAVRVVGDGGKKAVLGIGFEERSEAIDFGIALQEARKVQNMDGEGRSKANVLGQVSKSAQEKKEVKKDFSLKEGETIHVEIGGKGRRQGANTEENASRPNIAPPSASSEGGLPFLPPPPSAAAVKERRRSQEIRPVDPTAADLGFDDGEFGEFQ